MIARVSFVAECSNSVDMKREWKGLKSIVMLRSERRFGDKLSLDRRHFVTSLGAMGTRSGWLVLLAHTG